MKRLIIDGYNLLFSRAFSFPKHLDLEGKREHLIRLVKSFAIKNKYNISLVFDNSQKPGQRVFSGQHLRIIFCKPGQEADEVIKQIIRKESGAKNLTVVTNDRDICFSVQDHGITIMSCADFCSKMRPSAGAGQAGEIKGSSSHSSLAGKYDVNVSEKEVQFWKDLFERGSGNE